MLTRCPQCETSFRVTPEQLKARHGRVRCGECQEVFNALDTLVEEIPLPAVAAHEPAMPHEMEPPGTAMEEPVAEVEQAMPEPITIEAVPEPVQVETTAPREPEPSTESAAPPAPEPEAEPKTEPKLEPLLHEESPERVWPWALGICVALIVFAAQATMHFRTEIAVLYPEAKPLLAAACDAFGCELSLPRKPELLGIETSDLHPDADGKLALVATLKNRAPFAQEYPHLELTLTDTADRPLVRRVLPPANYLPPKTEQSGVSEKANAHVSGRHAETKTPVAAGFGANSEVAINLAVEASGIPAVGYRLYIFYP